ncbi:hypothetical protein [Nonomuraea insulae]|uniref:Uncharacterized protein n=1 Tax=Nonomuraea insulae TaxID=1616787 RepID=A0ABW1D2C6_9ACTN
MGRYRAEAMAARVKARLAATAAVTWMASQPDFSAGMSGPASA